VHGKVTDDQLSQLDEDGYVVLCQVLDQAGVELFRNSLERIAVEKKVDGQSGTRHIDKLIFVDAAYETVLLHPLVLSCVSHVLGRPCRLHQLSARDPLPGFGGQGLHTDWMPLFVPTPYFAVTALWVLDDFSAANGATRLVPGSHRRVGPIPKGYQPTDSRHPDEILIEARCGDVLVFNGHVWHGGTVNRSTSSRRALQCQYVAADAGIVVKPDEDLGHLCPEALELLT
jgi:ectoine hydroxylase-related dioxygenase (phytanoyl-CoA dioxygenase family)